MQQNAVNIDICRASNDVYLLLPEAEKQDQSRKESSATKDLGIFEEIIKEKNE